MEWVLDPTQAQSLNKEMNYQWWDITIKRDLRQALGEIFGDRISQSGSHLLHHKILQISLSRHMLQMFQMFPFFPPPVTSVKFSSMFTKLLNLALLLKENGIWLVLQHPTTSAVWGNLSTSHFNKSIKWWLFQISLNNYQYLKAGSLCCQFNF